MRYDMTNSVISKEFFFIFFKIRQKDNLPVGDPQVYNPDFSIGKCDLSFRQIPLDNPAENATLQAR
jgi:hypothetical protein